MELRLNRARLLLLQTNMSVIDVALACGFVSASHFSKCYRDFFGKTPRKERGLPLVSEARRPTALTLRRERDGSLPLPLHSGERLNEEAAQARKQARQADRALPSRR